MKRHTRVTLALLAAVLLISALASCTASAPLYSTEVGTRTYAVHGGNRPNRIVVSEGGVTVWESKVSVKKTVGDRNGTYGLEILDLNFDGRSDIKLITDVDGSVMANVCYLQQEDGSYALSDALSALCNVGIDSEKKAVFSFAHGYSEDKKEYLDAPPSHISTDVTTAYTWENGALKPYRRVSLTYYSEQDVYCYSVSDYSDELEDFRDPDDTWLTPQEFQTKDFGFLYYFR